jgi:hypothetical protein
MEPNSVDGIETKLGGWNLSQLTYKNNITHPEVEGFNK